MRTKVRNKINTQIKKPDLKKEFPIQTSFYLQPKTYIMLSMFLVIHQGF